MPQAATRRSGGVRGACWAGFEFLLIGAGISVIGAWSCVVFSPLGPGQWPDSWPGGMHWPVDVPIDWPVLPVSWEPWYSSGFGLKYVYHDDPCFYYLGSPKYILRQWTVGRIDAGWPFACLTGHQASYLESRDPGTPWSTSQAWVGAVRLRGLRMAAPVTPADEVLPLPYWPLWVGLALDALVLGGLVAGARFGVKAARQAIRRRRSLCPRCAYPIGVSAICSECGRPITPRAVPLSIPPAPSPDHGKPS